MLPFQFHDVLHTQLSFPLVASPLKWSTLYGTRLNRRSSSAILWNIPLFYSPNLLQWISKSLKSITKLSTSRANNNQITTYLSPLKLIHFDFKGVHIYFSLVIRRLLYSVTEFLFLSCYLTHCLLLSLTSPSDTEIHSIVNEAVKINAAGRVMPERCHQCIAPMI